MFGSDLWIVIKMSSMIKGAQLKNIFSVSQFIPLNMIFMSNLNTSRNNVQTNNCKQLKLIGDHFCEAFS